MSDKGQLRQVLGQRSFMRFVVATIASSLADTAYFVLLGWYVISQTGSQLALGTTLATAAVPRLLFMLIGGVVADRVNRKYILMASLGARGLVLVGFAMLTLLSGRPAIAVVYVMAFTFGSVDAFYWPASGAIVPALVETPQLPVANSIAQSVQQFSAALGPLVAAILLWMHSYGTMFLIIGVTYLIGTGLLIFVHVKPVTHGDGSTSDQVHTSRKSFLHDIADGIKYTLSVRILTLIMIISLVLNLFFMGPINVGLPVFVHDVHWNGSIYGYLEAAFSAGAIVGGVLAGLLKGLRGRFIWIGTIGSVMGLGMAGLGWSRWAVMAGALMFLMGCSMTLTNLPIITYIQTITDAQRLGRIMSLLSLMSSGLVPVSYALSSLIMQQGWLSTTHLMTVCGITMALLIFSMTLMPAFRRMEQHPRWQKVVSQGTVDLAP